MRILPIMPRWIVACLLLAAAGCQRRPDFDINAAQVELARAFERTPQQLAVYGDGRGEVAEEWLVDFRIDGIQPPLQARYLALPGRWDLSAVRERPSGTQETPWESVAVLLGRLRGESREKATETMARLRQLSDFVGQYAIKNGNRFPQTGIEGLKALLLAEGTARPEDWKHDVDAWGQPLLYHASTDGSSYIIVAMGGDGSFDMPVTTYEANTEQGLEAYGGTSSDANADIIVASGTVVQGYGP